MFLSKNPSARALIGVGLFAIALASGCNKPKHKSKTAAPAASGSAAAAVAPAGPCQKYAAALCEKAGKESESCQALTASAEILSPAACTAGMKDIAYSLKKLGEANKPCEDLVTSCAPRSVRRPRPATWSRRRPRPSPLRAASR